MFIFGKKEKAVITSICFCMLIGVWLPVVATAQDSGSVDARKAELERELAELESQIQVQRGFLSEQQEESTSLKRDISILEAQIRKAKLEIRARDIEIGNLGEEIVEKNVKIIELDVKYGREKDSLIKIIQKTRELDSISLIMVAFANESISDFFQDLDDYEVLQGSLQSSFANIRETRTETENKKNELEDRQYSQRELRSIQVSEKSKIESNEDEKQRLLTISEGDEDRYKEIISGQEKTAAQIRAELFTLRGSAAIPFGEALDYANFASGKTGVRPALILAILAEESNLGENVGTGTWTVDMHPDRDKPVFEAITRELGLDPNQLPVSKKPWYGWGGAMGPAQFIPSTWVCYGGFINTNSGDCNNLKRDFVWNDFWQGPWKYVANEDRVRNLLEKQSATNPWIPKDAIMASALLMKENGASAGTYEAERLAALRYFAGWANARKAAYAFYGDDVMGLASKYQNLINQLGG